jgi:hypothetical protein
MFDIWYKYRDSESEVIDTADTLSEAQMLINEYAFTYGSHMGDIKLWVKKAEEDNGE